MRDQAHSKRAFNTNSNAFFEKLVGNVLCGQPGFIDVEKDEIGFDLGGVENDTQNFRNPVGEKAGVGVIFGQPVNVVMDASKAGFSVAELTDAGVKRLSVGAIFARAAYGEFIRAATELSTNGTFGFTGDVIGKAELEGHFPKSS